jgi:DNA-binding Lrp family transcriptional regulator
LTYDRSRDQIFGKMTTALDLIDLRLLEELQLDADRSNVELARVVGLSPAATLHRIRRLKESGVIARITARLPDPGVRRGDAAPP